MTHSPTLWSARRVPGTKMFKDHVGHHSPSVNRAAVAEASRVALAVSVALWEATSGRKRGAFPSPLASPSLSLGPESLPYCLCLPESPRAGSDVTCH